MRFLLAFLIALTFLGAGSDILLAENSREFVILPARDKFFEDTDPANIVPPDGKVAVFGVLDVDGFTIEGLSQVSVAAPDGTLLDVLVETDSISTEFDKIIAVRMCFFVPATVIDKPGSFYKAVWGPEIKAETRQIQRFIFDAQKRESYREFSFAAGAIAKPGSSVATIEVIADSSAGYTFLLYLLPIAVLFVILAARKVAARGADSKHAS